MNPAPKGAAATALVSLPFWIAAASSIYGFSWLTEHGLSISRDGAHYLEVAFDVYFDGLRLGSPGYPVGYSALIALAMFFEPFPVDAAALVVALSFCVVLLVCADLFRRASGSALVAAFGVLVLATLPAFWSSFLHALSDPAFCALVVVHAWCVARHASKQDASYGWLFGAALALALAGVVRTIAYAVLLVFTLYVLWCVYERRREPQQLLRLGLAHVLSWLPVGGIALVRQARGIKVHGSRTESSESLALNIERAASTFSQDLGVFLLLLGVACIGLLGWRMFGQPHPSALDDEERGPRWIATYTLVLVGVYVAAIIAAATLTRISPVGTRFFAPYYPLCIALACCAPSLVPRVARRAAVLVLCLGFASLLVPNLRALEALSEEVAVHETAKFVIHHQLGFDANPSTVELRKLLHELATQPEVATVSVLSPLPKGGQHQAMARTMLFRSAAVVGDDSARFRRIGSGRFEIRFSGAPEGGVLRYKDLPILAWHDASATTIHIALSREMGPEKQRERWLIAPAFADPIHESLEIPGSPLVVAESREAGAYRAHRFVWAAARSAQPENAR